MKVLSLGGGAASNTEVSSGLRHTEEASVFQGWMVPPAIKRKKTLAKKTLEQSRKPRADALRNRERVLEAARTVFSPGGPEASLEAVAKTAGVGIGTLYRHFPTREALFDAVYRHEAQQLAALAERLQTEARPDEAPRPWM